MLFEWDEAKNEANIRKHGVGFERACRIFNGPVLTELDDRFDYEELREISIGIVDAVAVLAVAHTDRQGRIRIISARQATQTERRRYEEEIRKGTVA